MRIAVLGATGAVGRTMLRVLEERRIACEEIVPLASPRSQGRRLRWRDREWTVDVPRPGCFDGCTVALFSAGAERSREWAAAAAAEGAVVVDNSSAWRLDPDVPLVVPEVNGPRIAERPRGIIANPNCSTIQIVVPLAAIDRAAGLTRVDAVTLQSVSGAGQSGVAALEAELAGRRAAESPFPTEIAGNLIPAIGPRDEAGWNREERKVRDEGRKILGLPELSVAATCVRVPVRVGHAVALTVRTRRALPVPEARAALAAMPGLELADDAADPYPRAVAGTDAIVVGRVRADPDDDRALHLWVVADNLRKGAATNAVQIAESVLHAR